MIEHIRPEFTPNILPTHLGYHLQIFAAGRAKISLQTVTMKKNEFFASRPTRDRAAFKRQKARSMVALPEHYAAVDQILSDHPDAKVFRLHEKGNNNATADNAHLLASLEQEALWLVMSGVVHRWELSALLVHILLDGKGKRVGEPSIFNEYVPTQEHDWQDATFEKADYAKGFREGPASAAIPTALTAPRPASKVAPAKAPITTPPLPKAAAQKRPPAAKPVYRQEDEREDDSDPFFFTDQPCETDKGVHSAGPLPKVSPAAEVTDYVQDDPSSDPIFFADLPDNPPEETFPEQTDTQPWTTTSKDQSMMYGRDTCGLNWGSEWPWAGWSQ
jgi:hypothetical protein